jgi:hypothetical protein
MSPRSNYTHSPSASSFIDCSPQPDTGYPSPALLDFHCHSQSPYGSVDLNQGFHHTAASMPQPTSGQSVWNVPIRPEPASTGIGSIATTAYAPFATYETCLPASYSSADDYQLPVPSSVGLSRTPSSSTSATAPTSVSAGSSASYIPDHTNLGFRIDAPATYGNVMEPSPYAVNAGILPQVPTGRALLSPSPQPYMTEGASYSTWLRQPDNKGHIREPSLSPASRRRDASRTRKPSRRLTPKEEANYQCHVEGCGKFFSRSYNYKSHLETHDELREYPFPCMVEGCTKKFVRKTDLQRHHQSVHTKERNHKCDFCGRPFARKDTLRRHMEDGCSRRFDLGTLDFQAQEFKGISNQERSAKAYGSYGSNMETLPPISNVTLPNMHR